MFLIITLIIQAPEFIADATLGSVYHSTKTRVANGGDQTLSVAKIVEHVQ